MQCARVQKLLSPYMDGELSEKHSLRMRDHLSRCTICAEELKVLQNLEAFSRETLHHQPSEAYWANFLPRLHQKISAAPPRSSWATARDSFRNLLFPASPWFRTAGAVASVLLVFIVGRALITSDGTEKILTIPVEDTLRKDVEHMVRANGAPEQKEKRESETKEETKELPSTDHDQGALGRGSEETVPERSEAKVEKKVTEYVFNTPQPMEGRTDEGEASPRLDREGMSPLKKGLERKESPVTLSSKTGTDESQWMYEQAIQLQSTGETEAATAQLQYILDNYPRSHVADDAQFQLNISQQSAAETSWTLKDWQQQRDLWQNFLQTYTQSELAGEACIKLAESWYHIATITETSEDYSQALESNRSCRKNRPKDEALLRQAEELEKALERQKK